jgi:hypothetical protein
MNRKLLFFAILFSTLNLFGQDQLSNGSFNNWTSSKNAEFPTSWTTSLNEYGILYPGADYILKSNDASNLNSSLKISTLELDGDTSFGFALLGSIANEGPSGGIPFSIPIDSIIFDAKFELLNDDTANVLIILKNNGIPIDMNIFQIDGLQSEWTRYAFPVNQFNLTPDSLILGFTSGDINNNMATDGSWFMIDNIRFKLGTTELTGGIPNPSFETWTDITSESPDDWFTYNSLTSPANFASITKTSGAYEGAYAVELRPDTLVMNNNRDFIEAMLIYGVLDFETGNTYGKPFVASPTNLTGYYKWEPNGIDTATIEIGFTLLGSYVGFADLEITTQQSSYVSFDIPLMLGDAPDSVVLLINGGKAGSVLTIDNLQFNGGNVGIEKIAMNATTSAIHPNPAVGNTNLKIGLPKKATVSYTVINNLGQTILTTDLGFKNAGSHNIELASENFNSGLYFVKVSIDQKETTHKLIVR